MKGYCSSCGRPLKVVVTVTKPNAGPKRIKACKSPICERYMQPQEEEA